jgi:regulator of protease activity HflC (stomatin/prohibitin superfamily)
MGVMQVIKRQHLFDQITREVEARLADFESEAGVPLGLDVRAVEAIEKEGMKNPTEPFPVRKAFLEAQEAGSRKQKSIEEGRSRRTVIVESAEANAREIEADARGRSARLVGAAEADAESMAKLLAVYKESESEAAILRETFHQRTMQEVLRYVRSAYVLYARPDGAGRVLRLEHAPRRLPSGEEEEHAHTGQ